MKNLHTDWLTRGTIDFEYKKYILLAYLTETAKNFSHKKLYPTLADLIAHYKNLNTVKENHDKLIHGFPKKINRIDLENFKLEYERLIADDVYFDVIKEIIEFAIPRLEAEIKTGSLIHEELEDQLDIFPVGIMPLHTDSGYILIRQKPKPETRVYQFSITIIEHQDDRFRGIRLTHETTYWKGFTTTFEHIKKNLAQSGRIKRNTATLGILSQKVIPYQEALLPIAKRAIVRYLARLYG